MRKWLSHLIYLLILLLTPVTVFAIPTANISLLGSGPRQYNFEFENTTSDLGYDIYYIEISIPSDPVVSNFIPPNAAWDYILNVSTISFTFDTSGDPANLIQSGCIPNCAGVVSFDTDKVVNEFGYVLYFTDPSDPNPIEVSGTLGTPVPEPASMFFLSSGVGVIGMLVYLRRFKRKSIRS